MEMNKIKSSMQLWTIQTNVPEFAWKTEKNMKIHTYSHHS